MRRATRASAQLLHEDPERYRKTDSLDYECRLCAPFSCDDPDVHLGVPSEYTPLKNRGCTCGADLDGRDCMCFEDMS